MGAPDSGYDEGWSNGDGPNAIITQMKKLMLILSILLLPAGNVAAYEFEIDDKMSSITYYVEHVVGFNAGVFEDFDGTIRMSEDYKQVEAIEINIDVDSLQSDNAEKDAFVKTAQFFDVKEYPTIHIKSRKFKKNKMIADVTIKGITKEVSFDYRNHSISYMDDDKLWSMVAVQGTIDRKDFGIDYNVASEESGRDMLGTEFEVTMHLDGPLKE